jgi:hypothetical protein
MALVNLQSISEYQNLNCERYQTEEERAACYHNKNLELTNYQSEISVQKAAIGSSVTIILLALIAVGIYFLIKYLQKRRQPPGTAVLATPPAVDGGGAAAAPKP